MRCPQCGTWMPATQPAQGPARTECQDCEQTWEWRPWRRNWLEGKTGAGSWALCAGPAVCRH